MEINSHTKIYGLFGYPVSHSFSPAMHNAAFKKLGLNAVYVAFEVRPQRLKEAIESIPAMGIGGVNLTVPHKEGCLPYIDQLSPEAELIGAVNTIVNRDGKLIGHNTDGSGFVQSLKSDTKFNPKGKSIFILGAGGAGRAVGMMLAREGAKKIGVFDKVEGRAESLVENINKSFPSCTTEVITHHPLPITDYQLLINATPVGMKPQDPMLIDPERLGPKLLVCDLVYNPPETKLLICAKGRGLRVMNGLGMLLYQGAISFRLWTQSKAPIEVMRIVLEKQVKRGGRSLR